VGDVRRNQPINPCRFAHASQTRLPIPTLFTHFIVFHSPVIPMSITRGNAGQEVSHEVSVRPYYAPPWIPLTAYHLRLV
jgi:hypothetical protein